MRGRRRRVECEGDAAAWKDWVVQSAEGGEEGLAWAQITTASLRQVIQM